MNVQETVSSARSFSSLLTIAERAEPHFSIWGSRYISVSGYEGTLDVDALAARTMELLNQLNYGFSLAEHTAGKRLEERIDRIYDDHKRQVAQANVVTRILDFLREFPCALFNYLVYGDKGVLWKWRGQEQRSQSFDFYTRAQFQDAFHMSPEEAERRGYIARHIPSREGGFPERWSVEYQIHPHLVR